MRLAIRWGMNLRGMLSSVLIVVSVMEPAPWWAAIGMPFMWVIARASPSWAGGDVAAQRVGALTAAQGGDRGLQI